MYHASCTCKMGKLSDPVAVVDSQARVIGVQNLQVVDASAFLLLPPGHPTSTICELCMPAGELNTNYYQMLLRKKSRRIS